MVFSSLYCSHNWYNGFWALRNIRTCLCVVQNMNLPRDRFHKLSWDSAGTEKASFCVSWFMWAQKCAGIHPFCLDWSPKIVENACSVMHHVIHLTTHCTYVVHDIVCLICMLHWMLIGHNFKLETPMLLCIVFLSLYNLINILILQEGDLLLGVEGFWLSHCYHNIPEPAPRQSLMGIMSDISRKLQSAWWPAGEHSSAQLLAVRSFLLTSAGMSQQPLQIFSPCLPELIKWKIKM